MAGWECTLCGYVYEVETGDPDHGVASGTEFENIQDEWVCPICGASKEFFEKK